MDPGDVLRDLGRKVAELRAARGLTQEQLSELLGVDPTNVRRIEAGRSNVSVRRVVALARALGCASVVELFAAPASRAPRRPGRPRKRPPS